MSTHSPDESASARADTRPVADDVANDASSDGWRRTCSDVIAMTSFREPETGRTWTKLRKSCGIADCERNLVVC